MSKPGFKITGHKGFHITFENGYTVSVQFGPANYCDNYHMNWGDPERKQILESSDAEVAVWGIGGELIDLPQFNIDGVGSRFTPEKVLELLNWAKEQK